MIKKRLPLYVMAALYLLAGINHFRKPEAYVKIIPPALGDLVLINTLAGIAEIVLALMLLFKRTQKFACYGIILMLIAFVPSHIYMFETGFCPELGGVVRCAPGWALWLRLLVFQPLLIWWAWKVRKV